MHIFLMLALLGTILGSVFSAVSTYDFVAHLDRQVHGLHCSFLPGMSTPDASGASGCHLTLMSPYSSFLREHVWGGIPLSLLSLATFAFLLFWTLLILVTKRRGDVSATGFLFAASLLPVFASLAMGTIAVRELSAFCKICVGIYIASALTAVGAYGAYRRAQRRVPNDPGVDRTPMSYGAVALAVAIGCAFVLTSTLAYALSAPDFSRFAGSCGELPGKGDPSALISLDGAPKAGAQLLEVIDPLCPACRAFERRFAHIGAARGQARNMLLFPLDNSCNWMVTEAIHPGACAISEAVLCADDRADDVLEWAFDHQEEVVEQERAKKGSAQQRVVAQFPALRGCVGSSKARARLNRALRWAVDNRLPVITPQLYIGKQRLCDADTDLGLDYMVTRMLARQ